MKGFVDQERAIIQLALEMLHDDKQCPCPAFSLEALHSLADLQNLERVAHAFGQNQRFELSGALLAFALRSAALKNVRQLIRLS